VRQKGACREKYLQDENRGGLDQCPALKYGFCKEGFDYKVTGTDLNRLQLCETALLTTIGYIIEKPKITSDDVRTLRVITEKLGTLVVTLQKLKQREEEAWNVQ